MTIDGSRPVDILPLASGITSNTTSATTRGHIGSKTFWAEVVGTGAVAVLLSTLPAFAQSASAPTKPIDECRQLVRIITQTRQMTEEGLASAMAVIAAQEQQIKALQAELARSAPPVEPKH